jgi:hypothetical protein
LKKSIVSTILLTIILIVFFSGCLDLGGNGDDNNQNAVIMTAREHINDLTLKTDIEGGYSLLYDSLENGDKLIIKDTISDIFYDEKIDETKITFGWTEDGEQQFLELFFEGDLTETYSHVDEVEITVTIKYVNITFAGFIFEMEIYEEQWISEEFFRTDAEAGGDGLNPLPKNSIKKA